MQALRTCRDFSSHVVIRHLGRGSAGRVTLTRTRTRTRTLTFTLTPNPNPNPNPNQVTLLRRQAPNQVVPQRQPVEATAGVREERDEGQARYEAGGAAGWMGRAEAGEGGEGGEAGVEGVGGVGGAGEIKDGTGRMERSGNSLSSERSGPTTMEGGFGVRITGVGPEEGLPLPDNVVAKSVR